MGPKGSLGTYHLAHLCRAVARETMEIIQQAFVFPRLLHFRFSKRGHHLLWCQSHLGRGSRLQLKNPQPKPSPKLRIFYNCLHVL